MCNLLHDCWNYCTAGASITGEHKICLRTGIAEPTKGGALLQGRNLSATPAEETCSLSVYNGIIKTRAKQKCVIFILEPGNWRWQPRWNCWKTSTRT